MTDVGIVMIVIGIGVTATELLIVWQGASSDSFFGAQASVARYLWRIGAVVIAVGVVLATVGAVVGS